MQILYIKFHDSSSYYSSPYTSVTDRRADGRTDVLTNGSYVVIQSNFDTYVTIL